MPGPRVRGACAGTRGSPPRRRPVVAAEGYGLPDSLAAGSTLLERQGIIDAELAARMRAAMGLRNVAVQAYETVDPRVVEAIATHHVHDLRRFAAEMVARYAT